MMDIGDAASDRILDWNHAEIDIAGGQRREAILEGRAGHRFMIRIGFAAGEMRIRPRFALENDLFLGHFAQPVAYAAVGLQTSQPESTPATCNPEPPGRRGFPVHRGNLAAPGKLRNGASPAGIPRCCIVASYWLV